MDRVIKSLNEQNRAGTLGRNTRIALRALAGERHVELAKEFGVHPSLITKIVRRYQQNRETAKV